MVKLSRDSLSLFHGCFSDSRAWWTEFLHLRRANSANSLANVSQRYTTHLNMPGSCRIKPNNWTPELWSQIRLGDPLNLSISISGGKETNRDSLSNGEWSGKSSNLKSHWLPVRIVVSRSVFGEKLGPSPLERGAIEGESPVGPDLSSCIIRFRRVA